MNKLYFGEAEKNTFGPLSCLGNPVKVAYAMRVIKEELRERLSCRDTPNLGGVLATNIQRFLRPGNLRRDPSIKGSLFMTLAFNFYRLNLKSMINESTSIHLESQHQSGCRGRLSE